jgi:hypothetical protein
MIKQTVTYTNFNDEEVTEDLYFHLSKTELIDLELSHEGGLSTILPEMVKGGDVAKIMELFKRIIQMSYGTRSADGKKFVKDEEVTKEFMTSPAFDALFMQLVSTPEAATDFITGMVPKDLLAQMELEAAASEQPAWVKEDREPTSHELQGMTKEQLAAAFKARSARRSQE